VFTPGFHIQFCSSSVPGVFIYTVAVILPMTYSQKFRKVTLSKKKTVIFENEVVALDCCWLIVCFCVGAA